ncbi:MAG: hypothetical protein VX346_14595 [Planctomycetota bacterium]|nr:hypothetical protein [Planctomycetota bacterium]
MQRLSICLLTLAVFTLASCGCRDSVDEQPEPTRDAQPESTSDAPTESPANEGQSEHTGSKHDLTLQLRDDFDRDNNPPADFEKRWTKLYDGQSKTENGHWVMEVRRPPPPGPGEVVMGGFATTQRHFNPRLAGTNGVEITVVEFSHEDYDPEMEKPGQLMQAWSLTVGSWRGLVGGQKDKEKDRGVQLHFDLLRDEGLYVYLVRGLLPEDFDKYPQDGFGRKESKGLSGPELRVLHEEAIKRGGTYITVPCLALATRVYRSQQEIQRMLGRSHRYGLYLKADANTVYWTLDGQVMDEVDISGYFSSSLESVRDGAFLSVIGVACFQRNSWKMDDLEIHVSP